MIHWDRVRQLRDEVGPNEFDEVVEIFLEEVQEVIARLHHDTNRIELEQNLHFLKGSALSLGFDQFSKLCQDGERQAAAGQGAEVDLPALLAVFESSKLKFVSELCENLS
ncbi:MULTISPECIES: Hpt domain-containing protein [unclassified Ruegeria]|uniref:Hpt domain-containing protein n=1 Tax=unclassified Ruegeria TaxID=2625375 RepID=UPI0014928375|nr:MULTISPECIES: Hpt domain-containing protein [unclassified Ruegeria]NOD76091.1 Hpt domain-containing protein [Ruegeria sp. HKCCD4332]NOD90050.1 Hpt domain-containing protein [Ruegeria sp. HKCCD4318]NOE15123.1 Hpt domain-containing protein [Ruegeria sp. HKCCD4318-2]NOG10666.1 Hpt domain-containing protein [Ruegeria sp. HKCCD4315]